MRTLKEVVNKNKDIRIIRLTGNGREVQIENKQANKDLYKELRDTCKS